MHPDTPYITVRRSVAPGKDEGSKIAAGMEVSFVIMFRPESTADYLQDLVVCTEREKFIVPIVALGAAPALDVPDLVEFGSAPSRTEATQALLVRNVGSRASGFSLRASPPFTVSPSQGYLAPGETLQLLLGLVPPGPGQHDGELEVRFESSGHTVYSRLRGHGHELDVGLSQDVVTLLPTYVTRNSQRTFKIYNRSNTAVKFAVRQHPAAELDEAMRTKKLQELGSSLTGGAGGLAAIGENVADGDSEDEDMILSDAAAMARRKLKPAQRSAALDAQLFGSPTFSVTPCEGTVWPGSEMEVTVQFFPDFTKEYEETAFVEVQGVERRLPILLRGKGLGPAAVFSYDVLDVGLTYCNTPHIYEVELQNRGKIDVEFRLLAPLSPFGKKFSFEPDHGHLGSGEIQVGGEDACVRYVLLLDWMLELFEGLVLKYYHPLLRSSASSCCLTCWGHSQRPLIGSSRAAAYRSTCSSRDTWPVRRSRLTLRAWTLGSFRTDSGANESLDRVDSDSCSIIDSLQLSHVVPPLRYTKELTVSNTSEVPMKFSWRVPEDTSEPKEFQMIPQKGTILPGGKQKISIEFVSHTVQVGSSPISVLHLPDFDLICCPTLQRYTHKLVLDMPTVMDNAHSIPIRAECVVPRLTLSTTVMSFGDCYLRYPYKQTLRIANESKLPAKFEVLPQDPQSKCLALFSVEPSSGGIAAMGDHELEVGRGLSCHFFPTSFFALPPHSPPPPHSFTLRSRSWLRRWVGFRSRCRSASSAAAAGPWTSSSTPSAWAPRCSLGRPRQGRPRPP